MNKIKKIFTYLWGKTIAIFTVIVLALTFIDYLIKWKMWAFVYSLLLNLFIFMWSYVFETMILAWLVILTGFLLRNRGSNPKIVNGNEKLDLIEKRLGDIVKKQVNDLDTKIKVAESMLGSKILDIERSLVDFEIENHLKKNQVGAIRKMTEKLEMDIKKGWGAESTLFEIREYIKNKGMPHYFLADLNKAVGKVPDDFKLLKEEVLKLAQEKLYKVN